MLLAPASAGDSKSLAVIDRVPPDVIENSAASAPPLRLQTTALSAAITWENATFSETLNDPAEVITGAVVPDPVAGLIFAPITALKAIVWPASSGWMASDSVQ